LNLFEKLEFAQGTPVQDIWTEIPTSYDPVVKPYVASIFGPHPTYVLNRKFISQKDRTGHFSVMLPTIVGSIIEVRSATGRKIFRLDPSGWTLIATNNGKWNVIGEQWDPDVDITTFEGLVRSTIKFIRKLHTLTRDRLLEIFQTPDHEFTDASYFLDKPANEILDFLVKNEKGKIGNVIIARALKNSGGHPLTEIGYDQTFAWLENIAQKYKGRGLYEEFYTEALAWLTAHRQMWCRNMKGDDICETLDEFYQTQPWAPKHSNGGTQ
jgi:hypothetical protein